MTSRHFNIVRNGDHVPPTLRGGIVAIGNFDGVHRGHQVVLQQVKEMARTRGTSALALTFEPHPRTFFRPETPLFRLTPSEVKAELLDALGLDGMIEVTFDAALAALTAEGFVDRILVDRLGIGGAVVGHDFHFGKARSGSPQVLSSLGTSRGFDVAIVAPAGEGDTVWSASSARAALADGDVVEAARILGYRWFVRGKVEHGAKRGRDLGFPTANIPLAPETELLFGVYAVRMHVDDGFHDGVASFGRRPQFDNGAPLLEVHLLDVSPDLYGKSVEVEFVGCIRPEMRFDSVDDLVARMHVDVAETRRILAEAETAGGHDRPIPVLDATR
ncbi:bifunctional riboflavin kinase/FAD synthetase [Microbaculum marinum]|uniref:Riboflavin biosynthesis protein n=1 Tax=Microbaculum marinum TaxID=1764581 RepID=A0AAW9RHW7_9HYPH